MHLVTVFSYTTLLMAKSSIQKRLTKMLCTALPTVKMDNVGLLEVRTTTSLFGLLRELVFLNILITPKSRHFLSTLSYSLLHLQLTKTLDCGKLKVKM